VGSQPKWCGEYCLYPPLATKAHGGLRGILHGPRKTSPAAWVDVEVKVAVETRPRDTGGRGVPGYGGLLRGLNLKVLDDVYVQYRWMDDLGGVTDDILAAQMKKLAENEVLGSGEDTVGADSEDEVSFSGRITHNPVAP
jgi:hypothetical protein